MDQQAEIVPVSGAATAPGDGTVPPKTTRRAEPPPPGQTPEQRAANAWTGQYPDWWDQQPIEPHHPSLTTRP